MWHPHDRPVDHPRSRGVYSSRAEGYSQVAGSSPLARGLPHPSRSPAPGMWIIPARAGFTGPVVGRSPPPGDHPRSRGVYRSTSGRRVSGLGSSPLARGLPGAFGDGVGHGGIIPARAGFTRRASPSPAARWDHPRSRGVYDVPFRYLFVTWGSSPLARGLQAMVMVAGRPWGIIPARAGFTHPPPP